MKFRPQRGSLTDSMADVREFATKAQLCAHLNEWLRCEAPEQAVAVRPYGFDARIGWDTHIVTVDGQAVGFTDGPVLG